MRADTRNPPSQQVGILSGGRGAPLTPLPPANPRLVERLAMRRIVRLVCTAPGCDYSAIPARHPLANPALCPLCLRKSLGSEIWAVEHHYVMPSPPLASVLDAIHDAFAAEGLAF